MGWQKYLLGSDFDESLYALLAGRAGGQTLIGGAGASEHLTLQSTAHATRGYVRAQDDLQLLSNILRDSGGNQRIALATSSPHLRLKDDVIAGRLLVGGKTGAPYWPGPYYFIMIQPDDFSADNNVAFIAGNPYITMTANRNLYGLAMNAYAGWNEGLSGWLKGLLFSAIANEVNFGTISQMMAIQANLITLGGGVVSDARGMYLSRTWAGEIPAVAYGTYIGDFGGSGMPTVYGLRVADQTLATNKYILECGPANPYLRLYGGADPIAGYTNVALKVGSTLYTLRTRTINGYTCLTID